MSINLELRAIKLSQFASQETYCYEGKLYLDGRLVANVHNSGHGGCDMVHWHDRTAEAKIAAHFASLPEVRSEALGFTYRPDLETWCGEQVTDWLRRKDLMRVLKRAVAICHNGRLFTLKAKPADLDKLRPVVASRYPGAKILQDLPEAEALDLYVRHG